MNIGQNQISEKEDDQMSEISNESMTSQEMKPENFDEFFEVQNVEEQLEQDKQEQQIIRYREVSPSQSEGPQMNERNQSI